MKAVIRLPSWLPIKHTKTNTTTCPQQVEQKGRCNICYPGIVMDPVTFCRGHRDEYAYNAVIRKRRDRLH